MGMSNQTEEKELFHAVSLSGGKDSTAMLLLMIERELPIDAVLTADTGMEFPEMYEHLQKLDDYLFAERGLHLTWLRHPKGFEWLMFEEKKQRPASIENRQRLGVSLCCYAAAVWNRMRILNRRISPRCSTSTRRRP